MKHSLSIHVHHRKNSPRCSLSAVISINGQRKDLPLAISCPLDAYDRTTRTIHPVPDYTTAPLDNLHLQQSLADINRIILQLELSPTPPTLQDFLTTYHQLHPTNSRPSPQASHRAQSVSSPSSPSLPTSCSEVSPRSNALTILTTFIHDQSILRSWSEATIKKFRVLHSRLSEYRPNITVNDINDDFLLSFVHHLQRGYTRTKKDGTTTTEFYRNTSLAKMLKNFRWFLRWAKKKGYYTGTSENFTMDFKGGSEPLNDIVYLTSEELHTLADHQWQHGQQHLERVVDAFLFACYCGLRYSDIATLKRIHIHDDQIFTTLDKTTVKVTIPLNNMTRRILDKYADYKDSYGHPFPVISSQKTNLYLKEAARICNLTSTVNKIYYVGSTRHEDTYKKCDVLSFHCARRTFITQALVLGIPDSVLIQFTGHTTTKMLRTYQGTVDSLKQQQISKFDTL